MTIMEEVVTAIMVILTEGIYYNSMLSNVVNEKKYFPSQIVVCNFHLFPWSD